MGRANRCDALENLLRIDLIHHWDALGLYGLGPYSSRPYVALLPCGKQGACDSMGSDKDERIAPSYGVKIVFSTAPGVLCSTKAIAIRTSGLYV